MKIIHLTSFFYPVTGGTETHIENLAHHLIKKCHEVEVFTSNQSKKGKITKEKEIYNGIKIRRFPTWFKLGDFASFWPGSFKAIKNSDADIIHVHTYRNPQNLAVFFTNKPLVLTPHWPNYPKEVRSIFSNICIFIFDKFLGKTILKRFNKILIITNPEKEWFKKRFNLPESKFELIPNCIPKSYLKKRDGKKFRKKMGIKNELIVLCLSRIHKSKGFDQVIKIAKYFPKVKFVIAGVDDGFLSHLKDISKNLNNIIYSGSLTEEEKLEAYSAADIFVHPSHYEGFGIVVLEAFSQQTAVLTSNKGGLPWVVNKAGLIFEDYNLNDLKSKLELLIRDKKLRNILGKKGKERVKEFTWEKSAEKLEIVYKQLTKNT